MPRKPQPDSGPASSTARVARSVAWNYAGYACQILINAGLTWYIVRKVTVVEYGLFLFVMSLSASLYLLDMGLSSVLVQAYVEAFATAGKDRVNEILSTAFVALTALGSIGLLVFCGIALFLPGPFKIPPPYLHEAAIIFIVAAFIIMVRLPAIAIEQIYQAENRFDRVNQVQLISSTLLLCLSVLVLAEGHGIVALALVQLAAALIHFLLLMASLPATFPGVHLTLAKFSSARLKPLIHFSKWAFLSNVGSSLFEMLIWLILGSFAPMREAAIFGLAGKPARQLRNLVDRGANVTFPLQSKLFTESDSAGLRGNYLRTMKLVFGAVLPLVLLGCIFARPLILVWAGNQYESAALVLRWLLLAALCQAISLPADIVLYACGELKRSALISVFSGASSVLAALLLVSRYGAAGLAAGLAITQLIFHCGWFTWAACRVADTTLAAFVRALFEGLAWPVAILALEIVIARRVWSHLSSLDLVIVAVAACIVYYLIWGLRTALPLCRGCTEVVAQ